MKREDMINLVLKRGNLNHLVINAHGKVDAGLSKNSPSKMLATSWIAEGFTSDNLDVWDRLSGKVKYIWFMNCVIGSENWTMGTIAQKTQAWVSAPSIITMTRPSSLPINHLEYFEEPSTLKHWNGTLYPPGRRRSLPTPRTTSSGARASHRRSQA